MGKLVMRKTLDCQEEICKWNHLKCGMHAPYIDEQLYVEQVTVVILKIT